MLVFNAKAKTKNGIENSFLNSKLNLHVNFQFQSQIQFDFRYFIFQFYKSILGPFFNISFFNFMSNLSLFFNF